jgi:hypothetical protein
MKKLFFLTFVAFVFILMLNNACNPSSPSDPSDYTLYKPSYRFPGNGADLDSPPDSLAWDVIGHDLEFDIYYDTIYPPKLVQTNWLLTYYKMDFEPMRNYYWQIEARDTIKGYSRISDVFQFRTDKFPYNLLPNDTTIVTSNYYTFSWKSSYYDEHKVNFYLKAINNELDTNEIDTIGIDSLKLLINGPQIEIGPLKNNTKYLWFLSDAPEMDTCFYYNIYDRSKIIIFTTKF